MKLPSLIQTGQFSVSKKPPTVKMQFLTVGIFIFWGLITLDNRHLYKRPSILFRKTF